MLKSHRSFFRLVSFVLVFFMMFNVISVSVAEVVSVAPSKQIPKKELIKADIGELLNKAPSTKLELKSKRTKYSTRYLNPDGSFTEEIFLEPKFYKDSSDKQWKEINNKLRASNKKIGTFENTANGFSVFFSEQSGAGEIASVEKDGKSIGLIPVDAQIANGMRKNNEINYKNIYQNTDIRYYVEGDKIKEDIVLNSYIGKNTFSYEVKFKGLNAVEEDGVIYFTDNKGRKLWYFEKPFMTDANEKYSDKVNLVLRKENGKTYVDVDADKAFLEDPNIQYPVTIDPTINDWDTIKDTFVASNFPYSSYSSLNKMYAGSDPYYYGTMRSLTQFYLPSLPSDSKILSADFNAYQTQVDPTTVSIDLYRITSSWTGYATWNTQPTIAATKESTVTSNADSGYWQWDITQLAKDWYNGVQANHGLMLKQQNESTSSFRAFNTANIGNSTPRLTINYRVDPIGLEDFWGYTKDGVNPANGNFVLQQNDFTIPGRGIPVGITRTYNSKKATVAGMFGYGWTSNVEAQLVDAGQGPITLIDGDGTRHIFGEEIGGGYKTHGGIHLDLVKHGDKTYTITQLDGTKTNFNISGKISSIIDTNNNKTELFYTNGKLILIKDASLREVVINYGANGYVLSINAPESRTTSYQYDTNGNLTKVIDPELKEISMGYNASHNLTSVTDQRNITTTITYEAGSTKSISSPITIDGVKTTSTTNYSYDFDLSVTSVTDGEGRRIDYQYNPNKNITQITENPLDTKNDSITTFAYDDNNNLTQVKDPNTNRVSGTSAYIYTYDGNGNIIKVQLPENQSYDYKYDSSNNPIEENDANGNISTNDYDTKNNQIESTDPNMQTTASRYFDNGNMEYDTKMISAADNLVVNSSFENGDSFPHSWTQSTEPGKTATYSWTSISKFGKRAISISNPTGLALVTSDSVKYEAGSKYIVSGYIKTVNATNTALMKIEFIDTKGEPMHSHTKSSYGIKGNHDWTRVNTVVDSVPDGTEKIRISVGMNPGSGTAYFDGVQLEKGTVLSEYNLVENAGFEKYDKNNKPNSWDDSGNLTINDKVYVKSGPEDDKVHAGNSSFKMTGESGKNKYIKQRIYVSGDENTKLTLSGWSKQEDTNQSGGDYALQVAVNYTVGDSDWSYANDFSKTTAGWQHVAAEINPTRAFESIDVYCYYYNQTGTAWFDAMRLGVGNAITGYEYDAKQNYVTKVTDSLGNKVQYQYDTFGNNTSITDGKGKITSFTYDKKNLLTNVKDAKLNETLYGYDNTGNRTTVTDARNKVTSYNYNEFNQVSKIINPLNQIIQFGYDKNKNTTKIIFPNGDTVSYSYNALNRLNEVYHNGAKKWDYGYDANGNMTSVTEIATGKNTAYTYDKNDRMTKQQEGLSNSIDYGYDKNSNLTAMTIKGGAATSTHGYNYNPLNQITSLTRNGADIENLIYDEQGNVISVKRSNGTYTSFEYDDASRLKAVKNYNTAGVLLDKYEYNYDANGNRTSVATNTGTITYKYDELNQLTEETLLDGTTISYEYDAVGNRTKKTITKGSSTTTNYTYNDGNELIAVNGHAYKYDVNGNLTNNVDKTFIYDIENRLIEVKNSSNKTVATFTYDHEGKRNSMTSAGSTVYFHYNGDKVVYETDSSNNIIAEYTYDAQDNPATMTKNGTTYYYHVNGHGDVMNLTDESGNVVAQYSYDAYGNILSQSGTMASANPLRYAGYRYDEVTGLYYLMARYYDANVGRFITRDSFHGFVDESKSLNQYAYVYNNPVMYVDPTGHIPNGWWNNVVNVGRILDALITLISVGQTISGYYAAKTFLKKNKNKVLYQIRGKILAMFGKPVAAGLSGALNIALTLVGSSVGQLIAKALDYADPWWGKRRNNGYVFG